MPSRRAAPQVVVIAGPNGAGKSTVAPRVLRKSFGVDEFVNADTIAAGLSALRPESVAMAAGRVMLRRMRDLASRGASFGFETTLASRHILPWLARLQREGYHVVVVFVGLPHVDMAIARVRERVRVGGHSVPVPVIRRRFRRGLAHLVADYLPLADEWIVFDNSAASGPRLAADVGADAPQRSMMKGSGSRSGRAPRRGSRHTSPAVLAVARRAVVEALELHRALGNPIAEWRHGRVLWIPARQIRTRS